MSAGIQYSQDESLFDFSARRLESLARSLGFDAREAREMLERLSRPWAALARRAGPVWPSDVGDDHTPLEFSVAFGRTNQEHELRILVEPLGETPSLAANREATLSLLRSLGERYGLDRTNLDRVSDLFWPHAPEGRFAAWLAAGLSSSGYWSFKIYLNPEARGPEAARRLIEEALVRLGFARSWPLVANQLLTGEFDSLKYFALDLSSGPEARVKVYAKHFRATKEQFEGRSSVSNHSVKHEVCAFLDAVAPDTLGEFGGRGLFTCYSFVAGNDFPDTVTTHFPVNGYVENDRVACERVTRALDHFGLDVGAYRRVLAAYAERPLEAARGLQSYASFRRDPKGPRVTVYFPVEAYVPGTVAAADVPELPREPVRVLEGYELKRPITDHPFLVRLRREPVDLCKLWFILHNFQISISMNFARHLARVTARIEDNHVRCVLAEQLSEELGSGRYERAHAKLFSRMMAQMEPYKPERLRPSQSIPGHGFDRRLALIYDDADAYKGLGAILAGEVFGKQIDQFLGSEFRRQTEVDTESLEWITLHEKLEIEHADNSALLATLIPETSHAAVVAGAIGMAQAGYHFLDDLYTVCYGHPQAERDAAA